MKQLLKKMRLISILSIVLSYVLVNHNIAIFAQDERILTMGPHVTELFTALNLDTKIVGTTLNNHSRGPLPEYASRIAKIPELTYGSASKEAVITSGANVIYAVDWEFGQGGLDSDELATYGIQVMLFNPQTIDELYEQIANIGKKFTVEAQAAQLIKNQKQRLEKVQSQVSHKSTPTILVYDSGDNGVFTASGSNYETRLIEMAGGQNIFADVTDKEWFTASKEEILARNPEWIIIHDYDQPSVEHKIMQLESDVVLKNLSAVQAHHYIILSLEAVLPGIRTALTVETIAEKIHGVEIK